MKAKIGLYILYTLNLLFIFFLLNSAFGQSIKDLKVDFCNSGYLTKSLNIQTDSAQTNEICTQFYSNSDQDIEVTIGFPDGIITKDQLQIRSCKPESSIENFGKYVIQNSKNVLIPPKETIIQKNYIKFPAGFSGIVRGCMTYFIENDNFKLNNGFNIISRQNKYIDVLVGGNFKRDIYLQNNSGTSKKEIIINVIGKNEAFLKLNFINNGDTEEIFYGSLEVNGLFGFYKKVTIQPIKIFSKSNKEVEIKISNLPFYGGLFKVKLNGEIKPEINFNIDTINQNLKKPIKIEKNTKFLIIPRNIIIIISILLGIHYFFNKNNRKSNK